VTAYHLAGKGSKSYSKRMRSSKRQPSIVKKIKKIVTTGISPPKPLPTKHKARPTPAAASPTSVAPTDGNPPTSIPPPEVAPEVHTETEVKKELEEEAEEAKEEEKGDGKSINKPIEEMSEKEFEKNFETKGEPTYDQKRVLLGQIPIPPPGKPVSTFVNLDEIPPFAEPPTGLVYKDIKFNGAPKGIQEMYRGWMAEFRKGVADPKGQATLNVLVQGPPGTGKTEGIRFLAQDTRLPFWNIQGENLDPMSLFGAWTKNKNQEVVFEEGTLVQAVRHGGILLLDELNAFPQDVQIRLNSLLDDRRTLHLRETGEVIKANPELMIFATQNPPGEGTHDLIPQLKSRFQKRLWMPLPPEDQQLEIVKTRLRLSTEKFSKIESNVQKSLRLIRNMGNMELSYQPTLREAITLGRDLAAGNDVATSLKSDFLDVYYDPDERKAVAETINSVFPNMKVEP